jgi:hypothetical protein
MIQAFAGTKHDLLAAIEMLSRNAIGPMSRSQIRMIHVFERPRFICTRNDEQMKNYSVRSLIDRSIRYAIAGERCIFFATASG